MKFSKRTLIVAVSLVLAAAVSVLGTLAFLTSSPAPITNTFTVGNVNITIDETQVDENGDPIYPDGTVIDPATGAATDPVTGEPVEPLRVPAGGGNNYHLIPGMSYTKDPTVTVMANSEPAYIRMIVSVNKYAAMQHFGSEYGFTVLDFIDLDQVNWRNADDNGTVIAPVIDGDNITFEFRYKEAVSGLPVGSEPAANRELEPLFTTVTMPGAITSEDLPLLNEMEITVLAQAIQATGFASENAAWVAFDDQMSNTNP